jgi:hemolysin activation/secretion protein
MARYLTFVISIVFWAQTWAQIVPDAGQAVPRDPLRQPSPVLESAAKAEAEELPSESEGARVVIREVILEGNELISSEELLAGLGTYQGLSMTFAELRALAGRITMAYAKKGYRFARAIIPPQAVDTGVVRFVIIEGSYGTVTVATEERFRSQAEGFARPLKTGNPIEETQLERVLHLLNDQPGMKVTPIIRPSETPGAGDLEIKVRRVAHLKGKVGMDNYGNRFFGRYRFRVEAQVESPLIFGDQFLVKANVTDGGLVFGQLAYNRPIGSNGLRVQAAFAQSDYELGAEFASLEAAGYAKIASLSFEYPLIRSRVTNLFLEGSIQHKRLEDRFAVARTELSKSSFLTPIGIRFDRRDQLGGGGVTYGSFMWSPGKLDIEGRQPATDRSNTQGEFHKFQADLVRLQALPARLLLYARVSAQMASRNLDSSEDFGMSGPEGVRAYAVGEGYGDSGWLAQLELRANLGKFKPFVFTDAGRIKFNRNPSGAGTNGLELRGSGIGLRATLEHWELESSAAWKTNARFPGEKESQLWFSLHYLF